MTTTASFLLCFQTSSHLMLVLKEQKLFWQKNLCLNIILAFFSLSVNLTNKVKQQLHFQSNLIYSTLNAFHKFLKYHFCFYCYHLQYDFILFYIFFAATIQYQQIHRMDIKGLHISSTHPMAVQRGVVKFHLFKVM